RRAPDQVPQTADAAVDRARRFSVVATTNAERSHGRVRRATTDQVPQTADAAVDRARRISVVARMNAERSPSSVEGAALEMPYARKGLEGSNPSRSANPNQAQVPPHLSASDRSTGRSRTRRNGLTGRSSRG